MSGYSHEEAAIDWLHEHFRGKDTLGHLRARKRARVVTVESGPATDPISHVRFRRDTVSLWLLEMPTHDGRWEVTPYRDRLSTLMELVETEFYWMIAAQES